MALKTFKPYTKSTRGTILVTKKDLWKGKPLKPLTIGKKSVVGAGSVITNNVRKRSLVLTRAKQIEKKNYKKN